MGNLLDIIKRLSPKSWAMIGGAAAALVLFVVVVMSLASKPSYSTLETGLDPAQTGKITSTLSTSGIPYQLQNNGTALAVESGKTAQARVALATAGLLDGNDQPGFSLLDKQSLGQSDFQQQVTYERALEGQLASTIETINGVSSAQVNLVLPNSQDELFSDQNQAATASVLLSGSSDLQQGSVRGIAQLVASSVPGLSLNKVTVTGADGSLLWPSSNTADSGGMPAKEAAEQKYDSSESSELNAMLAQTLGAGKAQVVVNANLNVNRATSNSLIYGSKKNAVPGTQSTTQETLKGAGASAAGAAGTSSNLPAYSSTSGSGSGNSNYKDKTANTNFDIDKTVTHSVIAPGTIQQQSVSVLVDKSVPKSAIPAIKSAVSNAVGLNTKRGDKLSVAQLAFAPVKVPKATVASVSPLKKYGRYGALGLASVVFLGFVGRMLRKRERESFGEPKWLSELEAPRTLASLEARSTPTEVAALQPHIAVARRQVEDLVQRDPDRVAQHLRAWMAED